MRPGRPERRACATVGGMMKLLAFLMQTGGHLGGWRHPDAWERPLTDFEYFRRLAETLHGSSAEVLSRGRTTV